MGFFDKINPAFDGGEPVMHVYTYPEFKVPFAQTYNGRFEACYVMLTQFYILNDATL